MGALQPIELSGVSPAPAVDGVMELTGTVIAAQHQATKNTV